MTLFTRRRQRREQRAIRRRLDGHLADSLAAMPSVPRPPWSPDDLPLAERIELWNRYARWRAG